MSNSMAHRVLAFLAAGSLALTATAPSAQTDTSASEVTAESFRPPLQRLGGTLVFTGDAGTQAPPGADAIGITLSGVQLEGGRPELAAANAAVTTRLTGKRIPVSELFDATTALEQAYADAGFVLTRVILPQQSLRDGGTLRIQVVNGFVETIDTSTVPASVQGRLADVTTPLLDDADVQLRNLERQLLLAGDSAGVALNTALAAGERLGGTVLALDAQYRKFTGSIGIDTFTDSDLGTPVFNLGAEINSPFGQGESFYARLSAAPAELLTENPKYRVGAIGAILPLGADGLTLNAEMTKSVTNLDGDVFDTKSDFTRQSLRVAYPFVRSRNVNITGQVALDYQRDEQELRTTGATFTPIYRDEATILRFTGTRSQLSEDGAMTILSATASKGLSLFGAGDAGPFPSRDGADPEFAKLNLSFQHDRALTDDYNLTVTARAQTAFGDAMQVAEQFGITGPTELSTFSSGGLRGDSGAVIRVEVSRPQQIDFAGRDVVIAPYAFAGAGTVRLATPTALENSTVNATAYGIGVDLLAQTGSPFRNGSLRIEFGKGNRSYGDDNTRFNISGAIRF